MRMREAGGPGRTLQGLCSNVRWSDGAEGVVCGEGRKHVEA